MKRSGSICLLFILIAFAIIGCFWFGFLFGKESQRQKDLVEITEARLEAESQQTSLSQQAKADTEKNSESRESESVEQQDPDSIETGADYEQAKFYMKQDGDYVSVFVSATDEIYFETDVLVEELPIELQEEMIYGIEFYDLENVYTFLENYSS